MLLLMAPLGERKDQQPVYLAKENISVKELLKRAWQNGEFCRLCVLGNKTVQSSAYKWKFFCLQEGIGTDVQEQVHLSELK